MYKFTNSWFNNSELKHNIDKFLDKTKRYYFLEIGAYEGAFTCFISDNYLDHKESVLYTVDPFDTSDTTSPVYNNIKEVFIDNLILSKNFNKINFIQSYSDQFFKEYTILFDFIFIDGSHLIDNLTKDLENSLHFCKPDGIIWVDDYLGGGGKTDLKNCIDNFYEKNKNKLEIIHKNYQIAFRIRLL